MPPPLSPFGLNQEAKLVPIQSRACFYSGFFWDSGLVGRGHHGKQSSTTPSCPLRSPAAVPDSSPSGHDPLANLGFRSWSGEGEWGGGAEENGARGGGILVRGRSCTWHLHRGTCSSPVGLWAPGLGVPTMLGSCEQRWGQQESLS